MRPVSKPDFSWRSDAKVPTFDDGKIVVVMDGDCALCSAAARRIARWDKDDAVRIATAQSPLGRALLSHFDLDPDDPDTWLMLDKGRARGSLDGMAALFPQLQWWLAPIRLVRLMPAGVQDWVYARIARNRYSIWGKADMCALPDDALRRKIIS